MRAKWADRFVSHPDRVSGAAFAVIGALLISSASSLPVGRLNAPDAGFFPIILATLLLALGLFLVARSFVTEPFSPEITTRSWAVVLGAAGLLAYAALLDRVGFLICTAVMMVLLMKAYGGLAWQTCFLVGIPLVLVTYIGFAELGVPLPKGILGLF